MPQNKCHHLVCHLSHPCLFSHAPSSMSTSSSSPTHPTTQREHSVHPAHLQAPSVDKLRHQESLWREPQLPHDQSRLKTMFMDENGVREALMTTATRQAFAQSELRRILCCSSAEPPQTCRWLWYHIMDATLELRWTGPKTLRTFDFRQKRGRWKSAKSARRCEKSGRVSQS